MKPSLGRNMRQKRLSEKLYTRKKERHKKIFIKRHKKGPTGR